MKYSCYVCGHSFEEKDKLVCPICGNEDRDYLMKYIDISNNKKNMTTYQERIKHLLNRKSHSAAYIKVCSKKLYELGYYELSNELEQIAENKLKDEATLLELFGVTDDIRLNLDNILKTAVEDYHLSKEVAALEKTNNNEAIFDLLYEMKINEEKNIHILSNICKNINNQTIERR